MTARGFNIVLLSLLSLWLLLAASGCDYEEKPVYEGDWVIKDACTPYMIDVPPFHTPISEWRVTHKRFLEDGLYTEKRCLICHEPDVACNRCHNYVGVKPVYPELQDPGYSPGFIRVWHSVAPEEY